MQEEKMKVEKEKWETPELEKLVLGKTESGDWTGAAEDAVYNPS